MPDLPAYQQFEAGAAHRYSKMGQVLQQCSSCGALSVATLKKFPEQEPQGGTSALSKRVCIQSKPGGMPPRQRFSTVCGSKHTLIAVLTVTNIQPGLWLSCCLGSGICVCTAS